MVEFIFLFNASYISIIRPVDFSHRSVIYTQASRAPFIRGCCLDIFGDFPTAKKQKSLVAVFIAIISLILPFLIESKDNDDSKEAIKYQKPHSRTGLSEY